MILWKFHPSKLWFDLLWISAVTLDHKLQRISTNHILSSFVIRSTIYENLDFFFPQSYWLSSLNFDY